MVHLKPCKIAAVQCDNCGSTVRHGEPLASPIKKDADGSRAGFARYCEACWTGDGPLDWRDDNPAPAPTPAPPAPAPVSPAPGPTPASDLATDIARAVAPIVIDQLQGRIDAVIDPAKLKEQINAAVEANTRNITIRRLDIDREIEIEGAHKNFDSVLKLVLECAPQNVAVYCWSDQPGTGKSYLFSQIAKALDVPYEYFQLARGMLPSHLIGYQAPVPGSDGKAHNCSVCNHVGHEYAPTAIYRGRTRPSMLLLDELDRATPTLQSALNGMLSGQHAAFPCGMVAIDSKAFVAGAGNTPMRGPTDNHPDAARTTTSFLQRFVQYELEMDLALERRITLSYNPKADPWIKYCRALRKAVAKREVSLLVSSRTIQNGALMLAAGATFEQALHGAVFQGLPEDVFKPLLKAAGDIPVGDFSREAK